MAVEKKQITLKVVEDLTSTTPEPVVRLGTSNIENHVVLPRLEVSARDSQPRVRLEPPVVENTEIRTHQPGLEALINIDTPGTIPVEQEWGNESSASRQIPWGWFVLIGLAIASAIVWSLLGLRDAKPQAREIAVATESVLVNDEHEDALAAALIAVIEETARSYFQAKKLEDFVPLIRHPERVSALIRDHHQRVAAPTSSLRQIQQLRPITLDNRANFWILSAMLTDGGRQDLVVEIDESGKPRIDWETAVTYQPMAWDQFVQDRPRDIAMDFRVYIENDNFFSHEFQDANRWDCFRMTTLGGEEALFGYTQANGSLSHELRDHISRNGGQKTAVIVRLSVPVGIQSRRGVIIEKSLSSRWIYLNPPVQ